MKARCLSLLTITFIIASTGLTPSRDALNTNALATEPLRDEALAQKSGCFECHSIDKNVIGPAYQDVAAKYKDDARARETLIQKVKKGGKGNWAKVSKGVPMPGFAPVLSDSEIARLVDWVLSLENPQ